MTAIISRALIAASVAVGVMAGATPALARPVNLSVGVSTLGLGVQASTPIIPGSLDLAVGLNHFSYNHNGT